MKTKIVDKTTYFLNKFSKQGRRANEFIDRMSKPVYQRKLSSGKIALQVKNRHDDRFIMINEDGSHVEKSNTNLKKRLEGGIIGRLFQSARKYYYYVAPLKEVLKEKFYVGSHLEEDAIHEAEFVGGPVRNRVMSYYNRKSEFPQTRTGGNLRFYNMMIYKDEYEGRLYTEDFEHS